MFIIKTVVLLLTITSTSYFADAHRHHHFYRKDFTYFEEYDAFYKLHWDWSGSSWNSAFRICDSEGSKLFYPKEEGEWTIVKNLTTRLAVPPNTTEVYLGIRDEFGLGEYITIDGDLTSITPTLDTENLEREAYCVLMDLETGAYRLGSCITDEPDILRIFVCKKTEDKPCATIDQDYKYNRDVKKCYKVNNKKRDWTDALHTCIMEGSVLAVMETDGEREAIRGLVSEDVPYFAGIRRVIPNEGLFTIRGNSFMEKYVYWHPNVNYPPENQLDCITMVKASSYNYNLYYQSQSCRDNLAFVCEMRSTT